MNWKVDGKVIKACDANDTSICLMMTTLNPNWEANAQLIAKSPRMYEVLERLYVLGDMAERHPELRKEIGELLA
ncbi:unnamed protein product [marine sediment metagenome]|uniref:Uncharacterized protein n=1 Tax=marine sediment metagenome TaxID=412755 RepID=X1I1X9_9ZZZZ